MSTPILLTLLVLAAAQWLACCAWVMMRARRQPVFLASTVLLAATMFLLGPARAVTAPGAAQPAASGRGACTRVERGMTAERLRQSLGEPSSIINDEDTQGPGSEAWVYADARCVVHLLDGRTRAVDFE